MVICNHFLLYRIAKELRFEQALIIFLSVLFSHSLFSLSFLPFGQTLIKLSFPNSQTSHSKLSHVLFSVTLKASQLRLFPVNFSTASSVQRKQLIMKWLHLFDTNIKGKFIMKEHHKQNALCLTYYQQRVSKNAMLRQIAPSTD